MKKFAVLILSIVMVMSFQTAAFAVSSPGHSSGGSGGGGGGSRRDRDTTTSVTVVVDNPVLPSESAAEIASTDGELVEEGNNPADPQAVMMGGYGIYNILEDGAATGARSPKTGESPMFVYACIASMMCFGMAYQAKKHI
ncbi:MAG: hypothetical protein Q4C66_00750 [Lachnospiraceae bacterium]|nr:hypothetical protein [Lachnospiraceae bacterium]